MLSRVLLLLLRLVVEQEGEVVSATNVVDADADSDTELSPRTRRIPFTQITGHCNLGTTSACAENTCANAGNNTLARNYLRVRGEYPSPCPPNTCAAELPPRARRIRLPAVFPVAYFGTTSACAENTPDFPEPGQATRNYLCVRGEYIGNLIRQLI